MSVKVILIDLWMDSSNGSNTNQLLTNLLRNKLDEAQNLIKLIKTKQVKFQQIPSEYLTYYSIVYYLLEAENEEIWYFKRLPMKYRNMKEIILKACKLNGYVLKYANQELRNDRQVVMAAIKVNSYAMRYVSKELKHDTSFMLKCVTDWNYKMIPTELKMDLEFNIQLITRSFISFDNQCNSIRSNPEMEKQILIYYKYESFSRYYERYFKDKEVILKVMDRYKVRNRVVPPILTFIDKTLRNDKEIVVKAVRRNQVEYDHIENEELRNDTDVLDAFNNSINKKLKI
ncbi:predicted protein [Naegleria gruberi]|uniref:Predicted protein n=1 Tax=Naegleria gruberi TaxID=5762 RepID=D2VHS9_NAEGR|nr:uncharacterized protein NAEGRDRAFT_68433 [Naegleria gruberi]EFC43726.1 predicted protein [Naegleria gruberi]|eukprot:XP_002676470.1 predicted protein [Naegleria gruberi strain NEG-M]